MRTYTYTALFCIFTFLVFSVFAVMWILTLPFDRKKFILHRISGFWAKGIYKLNPGWKIEIEGLENIKKGETYIVVMNHQSMLDIPLLYQLPFNFKWVSKEEIFRIPIIGWVLWMHDDVAIERGGAASAKKMMDRCSELLKKGLGIMIFPEGTRTKTGRVDEFKAGSFLLAKKNKSAVLPVVINGNFDSFTKGADGKKRITKKHTFNVKIMPPIRAEEISTIKFGELSQRAYDIIATEHRQMAPQYYTDTTPETIKE